ncbi:c-type cytochrome [Sulfurimonas sp.]|uniref:c-type cytochrome n=1 Tax=Sulfurimonas sp. TaxID=2022749 RepID=UPI0025FB8B23|nr:c-type cytochrome [Sulfurimonas sp.]MDD5156665.1 c-type cytochrome [Sulfurimonas sp.]
MKKIILGVAVAAATLFAADGAAIYAKCGSCHGKDGKNTAISGVALSGDAASIEKKLNGYKDGSFGGAKKGMMAPQVASLSADDVKAVSEYIAGLK